MSRLASAERVSTELSDNYVFQRSILAYHYAADLVSGKVLEIGTGSGYGIEVIAPKTETFTTIDKHNPASELLEVDNVEFISAKVPPLPFEDESFDYVISFQVIEHIKRDKAFVEEVSRVLKKGGKFIVSTPNKPMSITRNPWHVREYSKEEFTTLLSSQFSDIESLGVNGDDMVMEYYNKNRKSVERITKYDVLNLQYRLPRWILQIPYDILNRSKRQNLLKGNSSLTASITMESYSVLEVNDSSFDLYYIATK